MSRLSSTLLNTSPRVSRSEHTPQCSYAICQWFRRLSLPLHHHHHHHHYHHHHHHLHLHYHHRRRRRQAKRAELAKEREAYFANERLAALRSEGEARIQRLAWVAVEQEAYVKRRLEEERIEALMQEGEEVSEHALIEPSHHYHTNGGTITSPLSFDSVVLMSRTLPCVPCVPCVPVPCVPCVPCVLYALAHRQAGGRARGVREGCRQYSPSCRQL